MIHAVLLHVISQIRIIILSLSIPHLKEMFVKIAKTIQALDAGFSNAVIFGGENGFSELKALLEDGMKYKCMCSHCVNDFASEGSFCPEYVIRRFGSWISHGKQKNWEEMHAFFSRPETSDMHVKLLLTNFETTLVDSLVGMRFQLCVQKPELRGKCYSILMTFKLFWNKRFHDAPERERKVMIDTRVPEWRDVLETISKMKNCH